MGITASPTAPGDSHTHLGILVASVVPGRVEADRQGPGCYHQDRSSEGRHRLKEGRGKVADQVGDSEHQQRDGEEDAGAHTDEVRVSQSKVEFVALRDGNVRQSLL